MTFDEAKDAALGGASVRRAAWPAGWIVFVAGPDAPHRTRETMFGMLMLYRPLKGAPRTYEPAMFGTKDEIATDWAVVS